MDIDSYLAKAEHYCQAQQKRLTAQRKEILKQLFLLNKAVKAYDLLIHLQQEHPQTNIMGIYRTLDFLMETGLIHKIEFNSTFVLCRNYHQPHQAVLLVCERCEQAEEHLQETVVSSLHQHLFSTFTPKKQDIALQGVCKNCQLLIK